MDLRLLEEVLRLDRRHLGPVSFPLHLDVEFSLDVLLLFRFLLLQFFLLFLREPLLLRISHFVLIVERGTLAPGQSLLVVALTKFKLLYETSCTSQCLDMLTWHLNIDQVNHSAIDEQFELDGAWHGEDVDLELLEDLSGAVWPVDWVLPGVLHPRAVDEEPTFNLEVLDGPLPVLLPSV